jgi:hypothetical protein
MPLNRRQLLLGAAGGIAAGPALLNVAWFHLGPLRLRRTIGPRVGIPASMRASAALSMAGWLAVLVCGRLIAYV